jgi:hypothetical protein
MEDEHYNELYLGITKHWEGNASCTKLRNILLKAELLWTFPETRGDFQLSDNILGKMNE